METIRIIIEKSTDFYDAYADNCDGIYGAGETVEEAKENVLKGLELFINSRENKDLPKILKGEYEISFQYEKPMRKFKSALHQLDILDKELLAVNS
jgi:predicted RNase H-like HicB family nuclease